MQNLGLNDYDDKKVYVVNDKKYKAIDKITAGSYVFALKLGYVPNFNNVIEEANEKLSDDKKVPLIDLEKAQRELIEKINNHENVAITSICKEITEKENKQTQIMKSLSEEFKNKYKIIDTRDYLARSFKFLLKTDGTPEAEQYNKNLYESYLKNPEAFTHMRMKNLMNYDPTKLIECGTDKVKLLEFYRDNRALCMEANEFGDPIRGDAFGKANEFAKTYNNFKILIQKLNPGKLYNDSKNPYKFFGFPKLTKEQAELIQKNINKLGKKIDNEDRILLDKAAGKGFKVEIGAEFYNKLAEKGLKIDKDLFLKYKAMETNPETGEKKEVSIYQFAEGKPNITIEERSKDEISKINRISKAFTYKYNDEFQKRMGQKLETNYNVFQVIKENKGGYFENLFGTTSREYKEFIDALADFTNPAKEGFLDDEKLNEKVDAYLEHTQNVKPGKNENNETRVRRIRLANAVKQTLADMKKDDTKITNEINNQISALVPNAIEHYKENIEIELIENEVQKDLDKSFALEKNLDDSLDESLENDPKI